MYVLRANKLLATASKLSSSGGGSLYMKWNLIGTTATPENVLYYKYGLKKKRLVRGETGFWSRVAPSYFILFYILFFIIFVLLFSTRY